MPISETSLAPVPTAALDLHTAALLARRAARHAFRFSPLGRKQWFAVVSSEKAHDQTPVGRVRIVQQTAMNQESPIVCPLWKPHDRRSHGGSRFHVQPLRCVRCGMRVAVPLAIWWRKWKEPLAVICEPCSIIVEHTDANPTVE